jgi:hypothetical protein
MNKQTLKYCEIRLVYLKLRKVCGSGNTCPLCKNNGRFGSISCMVDDEDNNKNVAMICGHCESIIDLRTIRKVN